MNYSQHTSRASLKAFDMMPKMRMARPGEKSKNKNVATSRKD
jgi:hypothetical protein